jgi:lysophospholipase L1-like esterase
MALRRALTVIGWNAAILTAGLLVIEAIFGGWFSSGGFGALHIPRDVVLRHDISNKGQAGGIAVYRRDQWGLRGGHETPDRIDLLALGGSTTNELYIDDNETWTAVLQREFAAAGRPVIIANAGIDGHSTVGHLNSFDLWFPRVPGLKPKFVLFYVGINDVQVEEHARYDMIAPKTGWRRFRRVVSNNSALNSAFRTLRGMLRARRARLVYLDDPPILAPIDAKPMADKAAYKARIAGFAARLAALAGKVGEMGARAIFVTQRRGDAFTINGRNHATGPDALVNRQVQNLFNAATMRVCRETRAICVDLAGEIDLMAGDFTDAVHTNPSGSRKIGEYLYHRLKRFF